MQYAFNLKTEVARKRDGGVLVLEKLCLAFDELAEAEKWRQAIAQQVIILILHEINPQGQIVSFCNARQAFACLRSRQVMHPFALAIQA